MNPIYKFELTFGQTTRRVYPIYKGDLAKVFEKESGQEFFRAKLSGNLTFEKNDYLTIVAQAFDTKFSIEIFVSENAGQTWLSYWRGTFWKTDCEFDEDSKTVVVQPTVSDQYNDIIAGLDKEFNLIDLAPEIMQIRADKRPMVQVYIAGQDSIACFCSGSWWEQSCEIVNENETIEIGYQTVSKLEGYYYFNKYVRERIISTSGNDAVPEVFNGIAPDGQNRSYVNGEYTFVYRMVTGSGYVTYYWEIARSSDNVVMWRYSATSAQITPWTSSVYILEPVSGTGAVGQIEISWRDIVVYTRFVTDIEEINGVRSFDLPVDDITGNNQNYHKVFPYGRSGIINFSHEMSNSPTRWGLYKPGKYYKQPSVYPNPELYPISRNAWGAVSVWFSFYRFDELDEQSARKQFVIKHSYPIYSVISVLLNSIAPEVVHHGTVDYSRFLYGENLIGITQTIAICPKSNLVSSNYDQPAQKANITLRDVFDMLRDCFRCFWFVDSDNHLRIEHISFFRNGGSYTATPIVGVDLTKETVTRNNKSWAFGKNQYKFDKPEMAARYQFGWMDDVTQLFDGYPIDIVSKYVNPDNIEEIVVSKFTSDIDFILLNPSGVSKDGFVLLGAIPSGSGEFVLPYLTYPANNQFFYLQNGYVAFCKLQEYYAYDMPARLYRINGTDYTAKGIKQLKHQNVKFPAIQDPDLMGLIKTDLGNGKINRMSVGLSSRSVDATLVFETEGQNTPPIPGVEYKIVFAENVHTFSVLGGNYDLAIYGVTLTDGQETDRVQLSASDITVIKNGNASISRSGLTFVAENLGTQEVPYKTVQWMITWADKGVSAVFITNQLANLKSIVDRTTAYYPEMQSIVWNGSGTNVALSESDNARFSPGVRVVVTAQYIFTTGQTSTGVESDTMDYANAVLSVVSGSGLSLQERGGGNERYYLISWTSNNLPTVRNGLLRLSYGSDSWDYSVSQAANVSLPYDAQIEYLQGDGIAYLDLGFKATESIAFTIDFNRSSNNMRFDCGAEDGWDSKVVRLIIKENENGYYRYGNASVSGGMGGSASRYIGDCIAIVSGNLCQIKVGNNTYTFNCGTTPAFVTTSNFLLFAINIGSSPTVDAASAGLKIKRVVLTDSGISLDLIPVRVGQVGYMYDRNSGRLIGNAASGGAFVLGPDV